MHFGNSNCIYIYINMCVYVRMYWVYKENGTILPWTIPRAFKTCSSKLNFFGLRFSQLWGLCKFWDRWCGIRREGLRRLMDLDWSKNWCFCLPFQTISLLITPVIPIPFTDWPFFPPMKWLFGVCPCYWHSQRLSGVNLSPKKLAWSQAKIPTLTLNRGQWWRLMRAKMPLVLGKAGECDDTWRFCLWETMVVLRLLLSKYAAAVIKCCQMFQDNPKQGMYVAYFICF